MLRRAVILSVTVEGLTQAETARLYGVSQAFVSQLLARWRAEGDAALEPPLTPPADLAQRDQRQRRRSDPRPAR